MSRVVAAFLMLLGLPLLVHADDIGVFTDQKDIGVLLHPGSSLFDLQSRIYTLYASGENMWAAKDAFHFCFTKATGDLSISADISFLEAGTDKHRKACLMLRQSLDADSAYIDVALHGDGLTSLQFREAKGALTHEIQSNIIKPKRLRLERRAPFVYLYLSTDSNKDEDLRFSGASHQIKLEEPFYVGLAVCSHNNDVTEAATFSNVDLNTRLLSARKQTAYSTLETQSISSTDRRVVYTTDKLIESPGWTLDGSSLVFNIRDQTYLVPATGGAPNRTSVSAASSPRLSIENLREFSPDGQFVYSIPYRAGQIWRAHPDGSDRQQLTADDDHKLYLVVSPDGKKLVFLANPANSAYTILRLLNLSSGKTENLGRLYTPDFACVFPAFSPDSKKIAFVSQHFLP